MCYDVCIVPHDCINTDYIVCVLSLLFIFVPGNDGCYKLSLSSHVLCAGSLFLDLYSHRLVNCLCVAHYCHTDPGVFTEEFINFVVAPILSLILFIHLLFNGI